MGTSQERHEGREGVLTSVSGLLNFSVTNLDGEGRLPCGRFNSRGFHPGTTGRHIGLGGPSGSLLLAQCVELLLAIGRAHVGGATHCRRFVNPLQTDVVCLFEEPVDTSSGPGEQGSQLRLHGVHRPTVKSVTDTHLAA